jgi:signal transduction histidine kinase/CheY-like chemotaxis protein
VVVTTAPVRGQFLELMRRRFQLDGLHILAGPFAKNDARIAFPALGEQRALALTWTPERPGTDLLRHALAPVLLLLVTLTMTGLFMLRGVVRTTAQLRAANRAQSEFLANISHEMRTPLNGVVAMTGALARSPLTPQQAEILELIRMSGQTLEGLVGDMLDLARIETGALRIEPEPVRLDELARASAALFALRAEEKGLELGLDIDPAAAAPVLADPLRLKQILANLLSNAVKFTEAGRVALRVFPRDGRWVLEVEDTGIGFCPGQVARLFDRFQQADGSITRRFGGAGLGLAICRELCERMGGAIRAEGRPGQGARFVVELPLPAAPADALPAPAPAAQAAAPDPGSERLRILLADDHPTNRRVVEVLLAGFEVELTSVENGADACEAFVQGAYDVVLMDMQMPVMDGVTAIGRIRALEAEQDRRRSFVVMLTANALPEHRDCAIAAGADLHLAKPITPERLLAALAQAAPPPQDAAAA